MAGRNSLALQVVLNILRISWWLIGIPAFVVTLPRDYLDSKVVIGLSVAELVLIVFLFDRNHGIERRRHKFENSLIYGTIALVASLFFIVGLWQLFNLLLYPFWKCYLVTVGWVIILILIESWRAGQDDRQSVSAGR